MAATIPPPNIPWSDWGRPFRHDSRRGEPPPYWLMPLHEAAERVHARWYLASRAPSLAVAGGWVWRLAIVYGTNEWSVRFAEFHVGMLSEEARWQWLERELQRRAAELEAAALARITGAAVTVRRDDV